MTNNRSSYFDRLIDLCRHPRKGRDPKNVIKFRKMVLSNNGIIGFVCVATAINSNMTYL